MQGGRCQGLENKRGGWDPAGLIIVRQRISGFYQEERGDHVLVGLAVQGWGRLAGSRARAAVDLELSLEVPAPS